VFVCLFVCTVMHFSAAEKDRGVKLCMRVQYYPDRSSPILEVKGQGHQGQKRGHMRRGLVGSQNWGRRRRVRPYGGIYVLQAC